jgi:hypothetical protein
VTKCEVCGKEESWFAMPLIKLNGKKACKECWNRSISEEQKQRMTDIYSKPFIEADREGRRIVTVSDTVFSVDGIEKHLKLHMAAAQNYGYAYKSMNQFQNLNQFINTIQITIVFEKEVTAKPASYINCDHCHTKFDVNQYYKCPQCGAPAE